MPSTSQSLLPSVFQEDSACAGICPQLTYTQRFPYCNMPSPPARLLDKTSGKDHYAWRSVMFLLRGQTSFMQSGLGLLIGWCPLPSPLFKILANNPYAKPLRLAERAGLSPRSYRVVGQAELGMSHWS